MRLAFCGKRAVGVRVLFGGSEAVGVCVCVEFPYELTISSNFSKHHQHNHHTKSSKFINMTS